MSRLVAANPYPHLRFVHPRPFVRPITVVIDVIGSVDTMVRRPTDMGFELIAAVVDRVKGELGAEIDISARVAPDLRVLLIGDMQVAGHDLEQVARRLFRMDGILRVRAKRYDASGQECQAILMGRELKGLAVETNSASAHISPMAQVIPG